MSAEQRDYEKGYERCVRCGCLRPVAAIRSYSTNDSIPPARICQDADAGFCIETAFAKARAAVVSFSKGGGR